MRVLGLVFLASLVTAPSSASAQGGPRWAVVTASSSEGEVERLRAVADHARAALEAAGETTLAAERAANLLEAELVPPMRSAPEGLRDRIAQTTERVLEDVAFGRSQRALDTGQPLLAGLDPFLPALGRDEATARDMGNLCLYLVRAHLQKRDLGAARSQAEVCVRLVPDLAPDPSVQPPDVRDVVASLRTSLDAGDGGLLAVQAAAADPSGCAVRVQGRPVGTSPVVRIPVVPGTHQIQVECIPGAPGPVHTVVAPRGEPVRVAVHATLGHRLSPRLGPALLYSVRGELGEQLAVDVATIGRALHVERVLVVVSDGRGASLRAFAVRDQEAHMVGSAPISEPLDEGSTSAVQSVVSGRDLSVPWEAEDPGVVQARARGGASAADVGVPVLGGVLIAAGLAGYGVAWYFWTELEARGAEIAGVSSPADLARSQRSFDDARWPVWASGLAGATLATVGLPMILPQEPEFPWWSLVVGALGAGVAGIGIWQLTETGACYGSDALSAPCVRRSDRALLGGLLLEHAAPLLSVPVIYLLRLAFGTGSTTSASAHVREAGFDLRVAAAF